MLSRTTSSFFCQSVVLTLWFCCLYRLTLFSGMCYLKDNAFRNCQTKKWLYPFNQDQHCDHWLRVKDMLKRWEMLTFYVYCKLRNTSGLCFGKYTCSEVQGRSSLDLYKHVHTCHCKHVRNFMLVNFYCKTVRHRKI